jgi:hypothetical protein
LEDYEAALNSIFFESPPPQTFTQEMLFEGGELRKMVFLAAYTHIKMDSTPGFPYHYDYSTNEEVPLKQLYDDVNLLFKTWMNVNPTGKTAEQLFELGFAYPACIFVKGEPTKAEKVARLVFGLSLVMNVAARIIFGDYLNELSSSWETSTHKVGMDMETEEGKAKLMNAYAKLRGQVDLYYHDRVVSDDIQGWEYQYRRFMMELWHKCYLRRAGATPFHRFIQMQYMTAEIMQLLLDSSGYIHKTPFYIMYSGKPTTHAENSQNRGALARMDSNTIYQLEPTAMTNGDDCTTISNGLFNFSESLGFVHTDKIELEEDELYFCSQFFKQTETGEIKRVPDGLSKSYYNAVCQPGYESRCGLAMHYAEHPGARSLGVLILMTDVVSAIQALVEETNAD